MIGRKGIHVSVSLNLKCLSGVQMGILEIRDSKQVSESLGSHVKQCGWSAREGDMSQCLRSEQKMRNRD